MTFIYLFVCVCIQMYVQKDNLHKSVLSLYHLSPDDQTQVISFGGKLPSEPSHLPRPETEVLIFCLWWVCESQFSHLQSGPINTESFLVLWCLMEQAQARCLTQVQPSAEVTEKVIAVITDIISGVTHRFLRLIHTSPWALEFPWTLSGWGTVLSHQWPA